MLIEYMEYRAWGGVAAYKDFLNEFMREPWEEGFWRD
jgi:hypothetical protein